ncbi:NAD(P)/FAD-dependent oxidoreductase [Conexibacter sp. CPCC 206217]|uniref:NAD(P)/FAD-dependent oxidoreductase n=1 Tax=Conexibacter sp. CPCC 206217 TaxID=3064574 RepID=UPI0027250D14|nr:FAD/NAD(P)-binding oxidoreductase [Conexibacter sp. CPCC 206217]MDO8209876.1 FAD/NAD(P)-binding oxidoreductase [Conexibacter sp. CPCC 206217]
MRERIVIVGGGPAGFATAAAYRRAGGRGDVTLLASEPHLPYRRPPLTKQYLRGELDAAQLTLRPPEWFAAERILVRHETAQRLDSAARVVVGEVGEELPYDACVLATGATPARLPIPGADDPGILTLRTREDSERLRRVTGPGVHVAVLGSGFIGCEAAASLRRRGADVTLISDETAPQLERLGPDAAARIADWLDEEGVVLQLGSAVREISPDGAEWVVQAGDDDSVSALHVDVVLMAAGIQRNSGLAAAAGLELADAGAIATDAEMRTSDPSIRAVGDVAAALHPRADRPIVVQHWGEALNHGEVAGRRLAGHAAQWDVAPGFWSQIGERTLKQAAWGDGFDEARFVAGDNGAFTVWYGRAGVTVGVLAHERDDDYEHGRELVEKGASLP